MTARDVLSKRHELLEQSMEEIQLKLKESTLAYNSREEVLSKQEKELRAAIAKLSKTLAAAAAAAAAATLAARCRMCRTRRA